MTKFILVAAASLMLSACVTTDIYGNPCSTDPSKRSLIGCEVPTAPVQPNITVIVH